MNTLNTVEEKKLEVALQILKEVSKSLHRRGEDSFPLNVIHNNLHSLVHDAVRETIALN